MNNNRSFFNNIPPVTKNLLLINLIVWLADSILIRQGLDLSNLFGLHYFSSSAFHLWQPLTYMFMHGDFSHIFFNMFAVMMFGTTLEQFWGSKRYLIYYLTTGIGAGFIQELVWGLMYGPLAVHHVTIGASGAVFGILLAFAWLFPETRMFIFPIPVPIRARVLVVIYALVELWSGFSVSDNVAHFAHLGGMLFGVILILYWKKQGVNTGAGLWSGSHVKDWWERMKDKMRAKGTNANSNTSYSNYHYQEPIREEKKDPAKEAEINRILDKIKLSGYDSLTDEEKQILFKR